MERTRKRNAQKVPHVCIVGAGMSGLKCSEQLIQNGAKVTIYEARDRTGGRVHQSDKLGHLVDLGPNWIHGTEHNPFVKLASRTNSTLHDFGDLSSVFDCTGKYLDKDLADKQTNDVWNILDKGFEYSEKNCQNIEKGKSLMDFVQEQVKNAGYPIELSRNVLDHSRMWGAMIGTEIERQSLRYFWLEKVVDGDSLFLASTYKNIVDLIKQKGLAGADLHLSTEVSGIKWIMDPNDGNDLVEVSLADGTSAEFDEVVVTAPLGWLKIHKNIFTPELPPKIADAIDHIGWGTLEKAWVKFPTAWWHTESEPFPGETLFIRPEYASDTNPECWNQEIVSFAALPAPFSQPTIMFYIYGDNSKMLTGRINNLDPHSREYFDALNTFFRPYYSKLPNYDETMDICVPKAFECTNWQHDPWTGFGSYSNFQTGLERGDEDINIYRAGMGIDRGIWFAGEAVAPFSVLGTVTGAYWSGEAVAKNILALYSSDINDNKNRSDEEDALPSGTAVEGAEDVSL